MRFLLWEWLEVWRKHCFCLCHCLCHVLDVPSWNRCAMPLTEMAAYGTGLTTQELFKCKCPGLPLLDWLCQKTADHNCYWFVSLSLPDLLTWICWNLYCVSCKENQTRGFLAAWSGGPLNGTAGSHQATLVMSLWIKQGHLHWLVSL